MTVPDLFLPVVLPNGNAGEPALLSPGAAESGGSRTSEIIPWPCGSSPGH